MGRPWEGWKFRQVSPRDLLRYSRWVVYLNTDLYPFHLVSDFGTEFILEPKMAFVNENITIKKPFLVLK